MEKKTQLPQKSNSTAFLRTVSSEIVILDTLRQKGEMSILRILSLGIPSDVVKRWQKYGILLLDSVSGKYQISDEAIEIYRRQFE